MVSVIVIDNDQSLTDLLSEIFTMHGIEVLGKGYDGSDAIELWKNHEPEFVIMDQYMPKLNGIDALKKIKKHSPKTHVIIITADTSPEVKRELIDVGAMTVILKPFQMENILDVIQEIDLIPP